MNLIGLRLPVKDESMTIIGYRKIVEQNDLENVAAFSVKLSRELYGPDMQILSISQDELAHYLLSYNEALRLKKEG